MGQHVLPSSFAVEGETTTALGELVATGERGALEVDVVFPLLHGPYGEDGTVQGLLELAGLPYVGCGVVGSAVGMDKIMMKRAFSACGLANARGLEFRAGHDLDAFADDVERDLGFPCFVKPVNMGSSVGVSKARDRAQLVDACEVALQYDEWILVEEAITGREIEVAVLGDDPPEASVPGEIVPGDDFYSYTDKYEADTAQLLVPAPLTDEQVAAARATRGGRVRRLPLRGDGPGRPLPHAGGRVPGERGEHHPGVHADLDVPAAVGGHRPALSRAARPPGAARVRPPRPPRGTGRQAALTEPNARGEGTLRRREAWPERPGAARAKSGKLEIHHGAGERAGDPVDLLDGRHHEPAELVERVGLRLHDHVVGAGDVVGLHHAVDAPCRLGDLLGPPDLGLDEDICGDAHG